MIVPASSFIVVIVCVIGVLVYMQMRKNDMHAAMGDTFGKPAGEAVTYLKKKGYTTRVVFSGEEGQTHKPSNIDIDIVVDRVSGTVVGLGTD